ncbi:NB-ARC domain-containing protein [Calothrix sp. PCC 7507]|uniref:NB-ARC domain-containing protein n=1 Tax=Calothrix sp. PCC 7507 TaxID=99598 RepID=UPI00029F35C4|nr:NB-ARC domain-containing protein [Calothrix sp. PCC 7507]AFY30809.1 WD-40 repeat-containing protein [Calothrix sp. PCC 7507]
MNQQQPKRKRGVILTDQGFQKLHTAKCQAESQENSDQRYTLEQLSLRTGLDPDTLMKVFRCQVGVDQRTLNYCFQAFKLRLEQSDYQLPPTGNSIPNPESQIPNCIDWDDAPDVSIFYGRRAELGTLEQWIIGDRCRLVTLLGMGGIGKTWLSVKLATQIQEQFEFVIWRSLGNAPPVKDMLAHLLQVFSIEPSIHLPETVEGRISLLINYFKKYRCLLILDNAETILKEDLSNFAHGCYCSESEFYSQFFKQVGETSHQSCLMLTSREKPNQIKRMEGKKLPVRVFHLQGLQANEVQAIFNTKGYFCSSNIEWNQLIERYAGNPLALNIVSTTIQELFDGSIAEFLKQDVVVFGEIYHLVKQHLNRLSEVEKKITHWLAINYQPVSFSELRSQISTLVSPQQLLEALESLQERSLIKKTSSQLINKNATLFSLSPMIREYLTEQLAANKISLNIQFSKQHQTIPQVLREKL